MRYSFVKNILESTWQVDAVTFMQWYPVLFGAMYSGVEFEPENEAAESASYTIPVAVASGGSATGSGGERFVSIVPVRGPMMKHDEPCGPRGMRTIGQRLMDGDKNPACMGSILVFESGGGQTVAVPELADAIKACTKPVIAHVDGVACSAAMYASSYCKEIIASRPTDRVGCIGTMISLEGRKAVSEDKDGVMHIRLYADGSEEKNDEFEAAMNGDFKLIKERILNPHNEQFKADMKANRPAVKDEHLKGRTYQASEVVGVLVDSIGTLDTAVQRIVALDEQQQAHETQTQSQTKIDMSKFPTLLAVLATSELVIQDGQTSLNEAQLASLETALAAAAKLTADLGTANTTIAERDKTIETQAAKIVALEKAPGAESAAAHKDTDGDPAGISNDNFYSRYNDVRGDLKGE